MCSLITPFLEIYTIAQQNCSRPFKDNLLFLFLNSYTFTNLFHMKRAYNKCMCKFNITSISHKKVSYEFMGHYLWHNSCALHNDFYLCKYRYIPLWVHTPGPADFRWLWSAGTWSVCLPSAVHCWDCIWLCNIIYIENHLKAQHLFIVTSEMIHLQNFCRVQTEHYLLKSNDAFRYLTTPRLLLSMKLCHKMTIQMFSKIVFNNGFGCISP